MLHIYAMYLYIIYKLYLICWCHHIYCESGTNPGIQNLENNYRRKDRLLATIF